MSKKQKPLLRKQRHTKAVLSPPFPGSHEQGRVLGRTGTRLPPQVSLHSLGADHAGPTGRIRKAGRTHRAGLFLPARACPGSWRTILRLGCPVRDGRLLAGQHVLGADRARLRRPAPGPGLRMDGAQRDRRRVAPAHERKRPSAFTPANADRSSAAARTTRCPAPGAGPRSCWPSAPCRRSAARP
jgi:hypothetical protein